MRFQDHVRAGSRLAIVGIGATAQGRHPGRSGNALALEAAGNALQDAGLTWDDVDGLVSCLGYGGSGHDIDLIRQARIQPRYSATLTYGTCNFSIQQAAGALATGATDVAVLCYGTNQKTAGNAFSGDPSGLEEYNRGVGMLNIAGPAALAFKRHQLRYGTTEDQLGQIAVAQRRWAQLNDQAIFQQDLTLDDYLSQPYLVRPLRRPDVCMISDGGAALVVMREESARQITDQPIVLLSSEQVAGSALSVRADNLERPWLKSIPSRLYGKAQLDPTDVDVLYIQDPTAVWILQMLEAYGFCGEGEGGEFLASGRLGPEGDFPLNTNGGQLSESYMWGWLHLVEAVRQLRGEAGPRQVSDARIAQYSSTMAFQKAAGSIFARL